MKKTMMFLAAGLLVALSPVYGNEISPGGTVAADLFSNASNYTLLDSTSGSGTATNDGSALTVSYSAYVAADQNNHYCPGCLDFAFRVTNIGPGDAIESISTASFAGFLTDVGYYDVLSGVNPEGVSRNLSGSVLHFDFSGAGEIANGSSSRYLVVETNATSYGLGSITVQDGATVDLAGFAPVPEPMTIGLLGGGLLLLGLFGYRRRKTVKL
ncbi:MAG TPA: PEP-CTERM sorting domain-containing protein [Bryobacteraceae bacterium]